MQRDHDDAVELVKSLPNKKEIYYLIDSYQVDQPGAEMKTLLSLKFLILFFILFFLCTNEDVVFNPSANHYTTDISLIDSVSGLTLADTVYPGQNVLFSGIIAKGDSSKVIPHWNISRSARYMFFHTFTAAGDYPVIFTIVDKAGFTLSDTIIVHVKNIDNSLLYGRAFLEGSKDHRNINVTLHSNNLAETVFKTDSNGFYAKNSSIQPGNYVLTAEETGSGFMYNKCTLNITIIKGSIHYVQDLFLKWSYALTPGNFYIPNDTIIRPQSILQFPVTITDMHNSRAKTVYTIVFNNSLQSTVLPSPSYTFNNCGSYRIGISSFDSINKTSRKEFVNVYSTWDQYTIIKPGIITQVIAGSTSLLVNNRNRLTGEINFFTWDFNGDGRFDKDSALSSNELYTNDIPGKYTVICKSFLKNSKIVYDSFFVNVLPDTISSLYSFDLKVRDKLTNEQLVNNQIIFTGKELSFAAEFSGGDTSKVKPIWRFGNSSSDTINAFSFSRSFKDTGAITIVFSITDKAGASCKDTFMFTVKNFINGGAVRGKALFRDKKKHSGIIIRVMKSGNPVSTLYTDTTGLFASGEGIPEGTYTVIAQDSRINSEYVPDTIKNVNITKGMYSTVLLSLMDQTKPHFNSVTPSDYIFDDSLSFSSQLIDLGSGVDQSSFLLSINNTIVNKSEYTIDGMRFQYSSKVNSGNYFIKAAISDSAGNNSDTIKWVFSRVDTSTITRLNSDDSVEISVNDTVLFYPYDKWLNEKTHKIVISLDNKTLVDSLECSKAKHVFKTAGYYNVGYTEYIQGKMMRSSVSRVNVLPDAPVVRLPQDTTIDLNTAFTIKSQVSQKFGKIVSYVWKMGDSTITGATSDFLITAPETLPGVKRTFILTCTDDDNNMGSDTITLSFGKWVVLGNRGFSNGESSLQKIVICNGKPFVAFKYDPLRDMKLVCMQYAAGVWKTAGDTLSDFVFPFALSSDGNYPVIAFANFTGSFNDFDYATFNGNTWSFDTTLKHSNFDLNRFDVFSVSAGRNQSKAYIAYVDYTDSSGYLISRSNSKWEKVSNGKFSSGDLMNVSLRFLNETPYVAYQYIAGTLFIRKYYDSQWFTIGDGSVHTGASDYSFCFNRNIPYVATINKTDNNLLIKTATADFWEVLTSPINAKAESVSLCSYKGHLIIAYSDVNNGKKAAVKILHDKTWVDLGYISDGPVKFISMDTDQKSIYITYRDDIYNLSTTVMQLR